MSKEKKERALNEKETKNVSGGYIAGNNKGYAVYDDVTKELVVDGVTYRQAEKLNNLYNHQDQVEANAAKYDGKHQPWQFWHYNKK